MSDFTEECYSGVKEKSKSKNPVRLMYMWMKIFMEIWR